MNLREFVKSMVGTAGKATPELARQIVETLKAVAVADSPAAKRVMSRMGTSAQVSRRDPAQRSARRRTQKDSRAEQRRRGLYRRPQ